MKSIITKVLIIAGLISLVPFFSYAATASVTCSPRYANDLVGKMVTISADVQNGSGSSYNYSWGGDDGFDDNNQTAYHTYSQEGTMTITVTASSTDSADYLTGTCSIKIYSDATLPDYSATCEPSTDRGVIGQTITWNPSISGPLAPYSIVWTGTDLNSTSYNPALTYATSGDKTATMVSFQSRYGAETPTHNVKLSNVACKYPTYIVPEEIHNPTPLVVSGVCSASTASIYVGSAVTWNSDIAISGGVAPFRITWTDTEGTVGTGSSTFKTYNTTGTKTAYLTVDDNAGQSEDVRCGSIAVNSLPSTGGGRSVETCSSFTYTDWSACSNNSQSRISLTSSPSNCSGGTPVLIQTCSATSTASSGNSTSTSSSNSTSTNPVSTSTSSTGGNGNGNTGGDSTGNNNGGSNGENTGTGSNPGSTGSNSSSDTGSNTGGYDVSDDFEFNQDQNQGSRNEDIANLQNRLAEEGFYSGPITGMFGSLTREALIEYQNANDLNPSGILDTPTRESLNDSRNANGDYNIEPGFIFNNDQDLGTRNQDVANLQNRLATEGFYAGLITGSFGTATEKALKEYQKANGLTETGKLDFATRTKLNNIKDSVSTSTIAKGTFAASALAAVGSITDFTGITWPNALYSLFVLISIGLILRLFMIIKKSDELK